MARLHVPMPMRWSDQDAFGHVNNVTLLRLLEEVRVRALRRAPDGTAPYPTAVLPAETLDNGGGAGVLVARQSAEYLRPVPYSADPLDVQFWMGRIGGSSVELCYEVYAPAGEEPQPLYARAEVVLVYVDTSSGRPMRLPADVREAWEPYQGPPVEMRGR